MLLVLAVVASVECNFGPPPSIISVTPVNPITTATADVAFDVNFAMRTTKHVAFDLVPTFPSGHFSADGTPQAIGPIRSDEIGEFQGSIGKDADGDDLYHVVIPTAGEPRGKYVVVVRFTVGSAPCEKTYQYAIGQITYAQKT